jgi:hypothetical protein
MAFLRNFWPAVRGFPACFASCGLLPGDGAAGGGGDLARSAALRRAGTQRARRG